MPIQSTDVRQDYFVREGHDNHNSYIDFNIIFFPKLYYTLTYETKLFKNQAYKGQ